MFTSAHLGLTSNLVLSTPGGSLLRPLWVTISISYGYIWRDRAFYYILRTLYSVLILFDSLDTENRPKASKRFAQGRMFTAHSASKVFSSMLPSVILPYWILHSMDARQKQHGCEWMYGMGLEERSRAWKLWRVS